MRKLILGMAVVICLDLAFIFSVMVEMDNSEIARIVQTPPAPIISSPPAVATSEPETQATTDTLADSDANPLSPEQGPAVSRAKQERKRGLRNAGASDEMVAASTKPKIAPYQPAVKFEDTIIWIEKANYIPEVRAEKAPPPPPERAKEAAVRPVEKKKKKNIFSRALPVITKPYDWVKALVSKL